MSRDPVASRLAELRHRARTESALASDEAWAWLAELSARARRDRTGALAELGQLFRRGDTPRNLDGMTQGMFVCATVTPTVDRAAGALAGAYLPWQGKAFDAGSAAGVNVLTRWVSAFPFKTYTEPSRTHPDTTVLVIDYAKARSRLRPITKHIRDELVAVVPGVYLGQMLVSLPRRHQPALGLYFALRQGAR